MKRKTQPTLTASTFSKKNTNSIDGYTYEDYQIKEQGAKITQEKRPFTLKSGMERACGHAR